MNKTKKKEKNHIYRGIDKPANEASGCIVQKWKEEKASGGFIESATMHLLALSRGSLSSRYY